MTQEVLKLALEALEESWHLTPKPDYVRAAITAIKEALAQPEQNFCPRCGKRTNDIHTCTPPQRTWVGLTDEQIDSFSLDYSLPYSTHSFARAIEAYLKEKNT